MSKAATLRARKQRPQNKAVLKHQGKSGRTGSMFAKHLGSKNA